jgi:hypothetical protein
MESDHFDAAFCQLLIERSPNKSSGSSQGDGFIDHLIDAAAPVSTAPVQLI